ncbi:MAG: glyoxalase [Alphaproteobacteria bacterium]|nr:glyoxalase [Alphaproteobacteria bacterium]
MQLNKLDHVNIRTANLENMVAWYCGVLGMENGKRPPFPFPGAWLYAGDQAAVHLVGVESAPQSVEPGIEHFAMSATGLQTFIDKLDASGIEYRAVRVPGINILQINVFDCDGNHIHIDFTSEEADAAGL